MSAAFLQAAIPEPFTVIGRRLQPFSVGHQIILERFESAFAIGSDANPSYEDLILSVYVCSFPASEAARRLESRWLKANLRAWGIIAGNFDVRESIEFFVRYIQEGSAGPNYRLLADSNGPSPGAPFTQFLKTYLQESLGMSERDALNAPYGAAVWSYLTSLEAKGIVRIEGEEDAALSEVINSPEVQQSLAELAAKHTREVNP